MKIQKKASAEFAFTFIEGDWYVYMLECADGTIYTGITNDVAARIEKHNSGKGAKYTRARLPVVLKAAWNYKTKPEAAKEEYALKKLTRVEKLRMIDKLYRQRP